MSLRISILFFFFLFRTLYSAPLNVEVTSPVAILMNGQNGRILFDKNKDLPSYPASITKIATTLYCLQTLSGDLTKLINATPEPLRFYDPKKQKEKTPPHLLELDGSTINLKAGEALSCSSLLYAVMLASANDAANVLAENIGTTIPQFVEGLNIYLKSLGCENTQFINPHGLHHPDHKTTAHDMAIITAEAMKNPTFRTITSTTNYVIPKSNRSNPRELHTFNRLFKKKSPHYFPYVVGGKTGYTHAAKATFVAVAEKDGRQLIAVLMNSSKNERFKDAKELFEAAFQESPVSKTIFTKNKTFLARVDGADKPLEANLEEDVVVEYYPAEEPELKAYLQWSSLALPIPKGKQVGELWLVTPQNEVVKKVPLFASEKISKTFFVTVRDFFSHLFSFTKKTDSSQLK